MDLGYLKSDFVSGFHGLHTIPVPVNVGLTVSFQHQNEIERMEGLYVRSRQENDKAFRSWLREKRRQAEYEREEQWHQVKVSSIFM